MSMFVNETSLMTAEFANPAELIHAAEKMRDAGYTKFDCHSPFPIHGMDDAMGMKRSPLGYIVGVVAFVAVIAGFALQWWTSSIEYPIVIGGKPFFSYQAYGPVSFALMVLSSAFVTVLGMLGLNKLPQFYHKLFDSNNFAKVTNDGFMVSIETDDPKFEEKATADLLKSIGGINVEKVQ